MNLKRSIARRLRSAANALYQPPAPRPVATAGPAPEVEPEEPRMLPHLVPGRFMYTLPQDVELETTPEALQRLVDATAATWTRLGEENAHWSVLSWPEFLTGQINEEQFSKTGKDDLDVLTLFAAHAGVELPRSGKVLELGCGVGRLTRHLGQYFAGVVAVDISQPHLDIARKHVESAGVGGVEFVRLTRPETIDSLPEVELFYSIIVLQHNPPPVAYDLLKRCLKKVRPGGFAYFQIPTYSRNYRFSVKDYVPDEMGRMEMHVVPQPRVLRLLHELGFHVLEVQEDGAVGDVNMASHTFFARRA